MFKQGLIRPPRLRSGSDGNSERHATWLELFYDLVFAVAVGQVASSLSADYGSAHLLRYAILFVPIWWAWVGQTFYLTRFDSDDLIHRVLTLIQLIPAVALAHYVPAGLSVASTGFALSYAAVRAVLVLEYLSAGHHNPEAKPLTHSYAAGFTVAIALWIASIWVPVPWRVLLWATAIGVDFFVPSATASLALKFPPHFMHVPERLGQFTTVVIGEAVADIVSGTGSGRLQPATAATAVMGLVIAFTLCWGYFSGVMAADARELNTPDQLARYRRWLYAHLPLTFSLIVVAAGIKHILSNHPGATLPAPVAWLICGGLGACMSMLNTIFLTSPGIVINPRTLRFMAPHYLLAILTLCMGAFGGRLSGLAIVSAIAGCGILQITFSLRQPPAANGANEPKRL